MAYTALYRKWRPPVFDDVKGQDHIVTALKNQIKSGRIGHAYLFCGTRGTGKTTIAKIFAKAVNCEAPVDGSPCGECAVCRAIDSGSSMNVAEIDAASNNGVDNIREIKDSVQYSPSEGKYRVYIIDEVHMLSAGAFNALLKTLEEPPAYVIFILATTEVHKIPVTVLSRCQRYDFRRISSDTITARLKQMTDAEGIEADEDAIRYVAKKGDGSMRDSISLLDQCIAFYYGQKLTYDRVLDALGAVDNEVFSAFFNDVISENVIGCIKRIDDMLLEGRELGQFVNDFIWYLRNLLLIKTADVSDEIVDMSSSDKVQLKQDAEKTAPEQIIRYIRVLSELASRMKYSSAKRVLLEIAIIKLTRPEMELNLDSISDRLERVERKLEHGIEVRQYASAAAPPVQETGQKEPQKETVKLPKAQFEDFQLIRENWRRIIGNADIKVKSALEGSFVEPLGEGEMVIVFTNPMYANVIGREEVVRSLSDAAEKMFHKRVVFKTKCVEENYRGNEYVSDNELKNVFNSDIIFSDDIDEESFSDEFSNFSETNPVDTNNGIELSESQPFEADDADDTEEFLEENEMSE